MRCSLRPWSGYLWRWREGLGSGDRPPQARVHSGGDGYLAERAGAVEAVWSALRGSEPGSARLLGGRGPGSVGARLFPRGGTPKSASTYRAAAVPVRAIDSRINGNM